MPTRYYQDSDSCDRHHSRRSPRFTHPHVLDVPPPTTRTTRSPLSQPNQRDPLLPDFAFSQPARRRSTPNRVRLLRTASSPPVALHPASLRRSYLQLRGLGIPRHGLPPCCVSALAGAHRGREGLASPPSEPYVRFSRIRLSSWWCPHRDWLAACRASVMVKSPAAAKKAFGQRR